MASISLIELLPECFVGFIIDYIIDMRYFSTIELNYLKILYISFDIEIFIDL